VIDHEVSNKKYKGLMPPHPHLDNLNYRAHAMVDKQLVRLCYDKGLGMFCCEIRHQKLYVTVITCMAQYDRYKADVYTSVRSELYEIINQIMDEEENCERDWDWIGMGFYEMIENAERKLAKAKAKAEAKGAKAKTMKAGTRKSKTMKAMKR
jgi:hypothetical protein